jgi:hypothetical protein
LVGPVEGVVDDDAAAAPEIVFDPAGELLGPGESGAEFQAVRKPLGRLHLQ